MLKKPPECTGGYESNLNVLEAMNQRNSPNFIQVKATQNAFQKAINRA